MLVLIEDAAESGEPSWVGAGDLVRIGDGYRQGMRWAGVDDALVRPVGVVGGSGLPQCAELVPLLPCPGASATASAAQRDLRDTVQQRGQERPIDRCAADSLSVQPAD
jgi:hypothetical protein